MCSKYTYILLISHILSFKYTYMIFRRLNKSYILSTTFKDILFIYLFIYLFNFKEISSETYTQ
jgi:hypothetical protein